MPVIAALELDDDVAARGGPGDPHRRHRRLGARVHEPHHLERGHAPPHQLGEVDFGGAGGAVGPPPLCRAANGVEHRGLRVAQDQRAPRAHVVEVSLAVDVGEAGPARAVDEERRPAHGAECPDRRVDSPGEHSLRPVEQLRRTTHVRAIARKS